MKRKKTKRKKETKRSVYKREMKYILGSSGQGAELALGLAGCNKQPLIVFHIK